MSLLYNMEIKEKIKRKIPECCDIGFAQISSINNFVEDRFLDYYQEYNTIITIAYHVTNPYEWLWYKFNSNKSSTCDADNHVIKVCEEVLKILPKFNQKSKLLPYPGRLRFFI